jgi:hypothetical protein
LAEDRGREMVLEKASGLPPRESLKVFAGQDSEKEQQRREIYIPGREIILKVLKKGEINTGGTHSIDVVDAALVKGDKERAAGSYIVKREYYEGDIDEQVKLYKECKEAGLPLPPIFEKGLEGEENVLVVTNMKPDGGAVWSLNDKKERPFPEHETEDDLLAEKLRDIAAHAAESGIELTEYCYLAIVDEEGEVSFILGDFGHTEGRVYKDPDVSSLKEANLAKVDNFLMAAGTVEDTRPKASPIAVNL